MIPGNEVLNLLVIVLFGLVLVLSLWWSLEALAEWSRQQSLAGNDIRDFPDEIQ
jgi:hypothetical protein